jgi:hypothetical protein
MGYGGKLYHNCSLERLVHCAGVLTFLIAAYRNVLQADQTESAGNPRETGVNAGGTTLWPNTIL